KKPRTSGASSFSYHREMALPTGLQERLEVLAGQRFVFFTGLPATGKSLLVLEFAAVAAAAGRRVTPLQWDVARPALEASPAGQRFPVVDGRSHPIVLGAVGLWARTAVARWHAEAGSDAILIGEVPLVGGRLMELVRPAQDACEPIFGGSDCRFILVAPTNEVRPHIEAERRRRFLAPASAGEREEAPPHLLREFWLELLTAGRALGAYSFADGPSGGTDSYESETYRAIYSALLQERRAE